MHKKIASLLALSVFCSSLYAQTVSSAPKFEQGKTYAITVEIKNTMAQQAMGQSIDFNTSAKADHFYKVTNATEEFTTLHHEMQRVSFTFDGMGSKRSFNSENKKDLDGQFGGPIKELLAKKYDMIIDPRGKVTMANPASFPPAKPDDRAAIILNMLKDVTDIVNPPQKGANSFFKVLPETATSIGDKWTETSQTATEKSATEYTLSAITDTTIVVDFKTAAAQVVKAEMMGMETTTNVKSTTTGQVILDKVSGLIKEKTSVMESNGTVEAMGTAMPMNGKTTVTIRVKPE